jgi:DNA-directed RNA polymerase specialized sigma24 family protein
MSLNEEFHRLPAMERDILRLHQTLRKPQTEIAKILGVSQPTVNYRFKRAKDRLAFLEQLPSVTSEEIRQVLTTLGARPKDIDAMVMYMETNSQSEVARRMGASQGAVRYWVLRVLTDHLQKDVRDDEVHRRVRTACGMLATKPGIFNEPTKPGEPKYLKVQRRLPNSPKFTGRLVLGSPIRLHDTIYKFLTGELIEMSDTEMLVKISLESREITLSWPR